MVTLIKEWLKDRKYVDITDVRQNMGRDAMECFLTHHEEIGFSFCIECNYYVRNETFDTSNQMCRSCCKRILEEASEERV